jgi:hypothetical protein
MRGRHKKFEDWMNIELINYENKIVKICVFAVTPFNILFANHSSSAGSINDRYIYQNIPDRQVSRIKNKVAWCLLLLILIAHLEIALF